MLILSSDNDPIYEEHRKVWKTYMNSDMEIDSYFIQYRDGPQEIDENIFWLNGTESFQTIINNTIDSIEYFLNKQSYDFIIRTNLSSVWNFYNLKKYLKSLPAEKVYSGKIGVDSNRFISGSGIIFTPDVCRLLISLKDELYSKKTLDDVAIGNVLSNKINLIEGSRLDLLSYNISVNNTSKFNDFYHFRVKAIDKNARTEEIKTMKYILNVLKKTSIITSDKYLLHFKEIYYKTDVILNKKPIFWRGKLHHPPSKNNDIIISGHSDYEITDDLVTYYNPRIWWTINKQTTNSRVHSLPLGITNNTNESDIHRIYGNLDCMIDVMNEPIEYKNLVYMNFNINTHPERIHVFNLFKDKSWVTQGKIENTITGRTRFLREIKNHKFTLCPRGNGIDTHRLWETLYIGSIPIVCKNVGYMDFIDLPICFVDSWNDVTSEFLEKEYKRITSLKWNTDKLNVQYWIDKIKNIL